MHKEGGGVEEERRECKSECERERETRARTASELAPYLFLKSFQMNGPKSVSDDASGSAGCEAMPPATFTCVWACRIQGAGFRMQGSGYRVQGSGCRMRGSGCRVQGSEFRVQGLRRSHPGGPARCRVSDSFDTMYLSNSFKKSTPTQNRQLNI